MFSRKATHAGPVMDLPTTDHPSWMKVGIVAVIGFGIGIAWPKLAGVRLGPNAPGAEASAGRAPERGAASATAPAALAAPNAPLTASAHTSTTPAAAGGVNFEHGTLISCRDDKGELERGKACGAAPALDREVLPRLKKIEKCPAMAGAEGKLSLVVFADFSAGKIDTNVGKSSTVNGADNFSSCAKEALSGMSLTGIDHERAKYTFQYVAHLAKSGNAPSGSAAAQGATAATPDVPSGTGTPVVWEVAVVRDAPKTGEIVGRVQRGGEVRVLTSQEGWYKVKFGPNFAKEGWVFRAAIGK